MSNGAMEESSRFVIGVLALLVLCGLSIWIYGTRILVLEFILSKRADEDDNTSQFDYLAGFIAACIWAAFALIVVANGLGSIVTRWSP
jgi:hypothetical protein